MCDRMAANPAFPPEVRAAYAGEGPPVLINERMDEPKRRKKPAVIGVQFMGDLFHKDIHPAWIQQIFTRMKFAPQHTFIVLTKRAERMYYEMTHLSKPGWGQFHKCSNIWLGISVENQVRAEELAYLLATPAAVRFVSFEPLLGPIYAQSYMMHSPSLTIDRGPLIPPTRLAAIPGLSWCIVGAETGPGARPMDLAWARDLRDQCKAAGVPFFFKRVGPHYPYTPVDLMRRQWPGEA